MNKCCCSFPFSKVKNILHFFLKSFYYRSCVVLQIIKQLVFECVRFCKYYSVYVMFKCNRTFSKLDFIIALLLMKNGI